VRRDSTSRGLINHVLPIFSGAVLNLSMIPDSVQTLGDQVNGQLEVHLERNPDGKSLMVGLTLKGCVNHTCIFAKPVFNHTEIPGNSKNDLIFARCFSNSPAAAAGQSSLAKYGGVEFDSSPLSFCF